MKYNYTYNENEYKTPPILYNMALKHFGINKFDLDVCCSEGNIPAEKYCIKDIIDGLNVDWAQVNWCNPPFNECKKWVKKAYQESLKGHKTALLIPVRTETSYWHKYILNNSCVSIQWLKKGYKFLNAENEEMGVFKNALAIVYFDVIKTTHASLV